LCCLREERKGRGEIKGREYRENNKNRLQKRNGKESTKEKDVG